MRTTAQETLRNDEIILAAAIKVFSEKGYDAASMQDIADEAKISRGPLYYRYKTKKDIFLAAMDANARSELAVQAQVLRQKKSFPEKIREYMLWGTKSLWNDEPVFPMDIFSTPDMEDANIRIRDIYSKAYAGVRRAVETAVQDGELSPDTDIELVVNLIFIIYDGLRYSRMKSGIIPSSQKAEQTIRMICDLLQSAADNDKPRHDTYLFDT